MNSVGSECTELKQQYDACFNTWFAEKFLKGNTHDVCAPLFKVYQECVKNAAVRQNINIKELEKEVLGTNQEQKPPK